MEVVGVEERMRVKEGMVDVLHVAVFSVGQVQVVRPQKKRWSSFALSDSK